MATHVFTVGEKVYKGRYGGWAHTITMIDGDKAVLDGSQIVLLSEIHPVVSKQSDGWYTVKGLDGYAYYIEWIDRETPKYHWGFNFKTQQMEEMPDRFGNGVLYTGLPASEFYPVKLTTQRI
ncbi:MAG TPA: hypothetical protein VFK47_10750 [Ktedonobacteraceae bacterium]|nr:hypothetical protein [Ktedonobacteraceae bacterium]